MSARSVRKLLSALLLGTVTVASAQTDKTTQRTPDEARLIAAQLLSSGNARDAAAITHVLIQRDSQDAASLIIHAHALRTLGRHDAAQTAARDGWRAAETDAEKYGASLAMAQALSSGGKKTRAQFWLRRAANAAPNDRLKALIARDYAYLRKTNPWSVNLSFGIAPSDNVNNAPRDNTVVLGGLLFTNPAAVPISGFNVQSEVKLRYNFDQTSNQRHFLGLRWVENQVIFSDSNVPAGVDADDFSYRKLEATLGRDYIAGPGKPRQTVSLSLGRTWVGGSTLANELRLDWREVHLREGGRRFAWDAALGYSDREDFGDRSGVTASLGAQWSRPLENGGRLGWETALARTQTDSAAITHTRLNFGVTYTHPDRIVGAIAQVGMNAEIRRYDHALFAAEARRDAKATLTTSLLFVDFDTYGFAPKLTFEASRTNSNVSAFETQNFGLQIGFQSVF